MNKLFLLLVPLNIGILMSGSCCKSNTCCKKKTELSKEKTTKHKRTAKEIIKEAYGKVAETGSSCSVVGGGCCGGGCALSQDMGYTREEIDTLADANLGLGCGHPVSLADIKKGDTVLDLGSGAGFDVFLAASKVGEKGKVIGVDMTPAMIKKARENARKYKFNNVEFIQGDIEKLPVKDNTVDIIMSNCVINLAPNKKKVFTEAHRVLKKGGKMSVSDVVLLKNLTKKQRNDPHLLCACVSGAILKDDYITMMKDTGFEVTIVDEDKTVNKKWFGDDKLPISSLKFTAVKK